MPPYVPRKRSHSSSPPAPPPPKKRSLRTAKPRPNVFDTLDARPQPSRSAAENKAYLDALESEQSSLSDVESDEFEDVVTATSAKRRKVGAVASDSEDEMEWEDAMTVNGLHRPNYSHSHGQCSHEPSGDLEITLSRPGEVDYSAAGTTGKKGPTKIERFIRLQTHCMHVQYLLWHNSIRNSWINDKEVQTTLVSGLSEGLNMEVSKWRSAMGYSTDGQLKEEAFSANRRANAKSKGKGNAKDKQKSTRERIRDWGAEALKLDSDSASISHSDPLIRLLRFLVAYWKKRFKTSAPGLRKRGYRSVAELDSEMKSLKNEPHDPTRHGEKIASLREFQRLAKTCTGSRDIGALLFTALLRGLGIEARIVASLQPTGFGWTKGEEAKPRKPAVPASVAQAEKSLISAGGFLGSEDEAICSHDEDGSAEQPQKPVSRATFASRSRNTEAKPPKKGTTSAPISLDDSSSDLSSVPETGSEKSVVDITPAKPTSKLVNKDLPYPIYWTEVLSPVSNKYIPVSTLVNPNVVTSPEHLAAFEPRGSAAEKAKQVICYVVAYSADGTAKDVTVRYLKRHQLPGKTKGFRLPVEKVPIYNRGGKVLRYEEYDWFKRVMSCYARSSEKCTLADDIEDQGDLVPFKAEKTVKDGTGKQGEETLQGYKNSAEFVLERHLRREEAILPTAQLVKYFHVGKGEKATKEAVYRRNDVVSCKTVESWHKEGRQIKPGSQPLKFVPFRAVTLIRKREIEESTRETGEKPTQGLYSKAQTEWIVPDPIKDGVIPRNGFGNIDVYVPSMVPKGAIHVPLKGTARICKRLGIDFAEACTGFEFGKQRAVPVLTGVVVAEENEHLLIDAWQEEERIKREKEEGKKVAKMLSLWRKFLHGMRVMERMRMEYGTGGNVPDEVNPFTRKQRQQQQQQQQQQQSDERTEQQQQQQAAEDNEEGGFLLDHENYQEAEGGGFQPLEREDNDAADGGGFLPESEDEANELDGGSLEIHFGEDTSQGPLTDIFVSSHAVKRAERQYSDTPSSLQSTHRNGEPVHGEGDYASDGADSYNEGKSGDGSDDYVTPKSKREAVRGHGARSGRACTRGSVNDGGAKARPRRSVATTSRYFKS